MRRYITEKEQKRDKKRTLKIISVAFFVAILQLILLSILSYLMKNFDAPLPVFLRTIFSETSMGQVNNVWGFILPFFLSNLIAQGIGCIINYFKIFQSNTHFLISFVFFLLFGIMIIFFNTWLQGVIVKLLSENFGLRNITGAIIACIAVSFEQFIILYPVEKMFMTNIDESCK